MKLYVFFSVAAVLFAGLFWSCSDLSVSKEEALEADLPDDFDWKEYVLINRDVPASQIAFDVQKRLVVENNKSEEYLPITNPSNPPTVADIIISDERIKECMGIFEDLDFAGKIYLEYVNCPKRGWNPKVPCENAYANNPNYVKGETCSIGSCWSGGWDEEFDCGPDGCAGLGIEGPFKDELETKIANYKTTGTLNITINREIFMLCRFVLPQTESIKKAEDYLESFYSFSNPDSPVFGSSLDSILVKQHYFLVGRSEGRPYKYCKQGSYDQTEERRENFDKYCKPDPNDTKEERAEKKKHCLAEEYTSPQNYVYYNYSKNLFCLNDDNKIYLLK